MGLGQIFSWENDPTCSLDPSVYFIGVVWDSKFNLEKGTNMFFSSTCGYEIYTSFSWGGVKFKRWIWPNL